jgi:hypothetical protein
MNRVDMLSFSRIDSFIFITRRIEEIKPWTSPSKFNY